MILLPLVLPPVYLGEPVPSSPVLLVADAAGIIAFTSPEGIGVPAVKAFIECEIPAHHASRSFVWWEGFATLKLATQSCLLVKREPA